MMIRTMINGFLMALADSVPGVSGGTIALIMNFYDDFIGSINKVIYGKKSEKKDGIIYLAKLFAGWAVGMIFAILVLNAFFEKNIYAVSSLFLGFIFPSIFIIIKDEYETIKDKWQCIPFALLGVLAVVLLSFFNGKTGIIALDLSRFSVGSAAYLFLSGAVAIAAMFLPGISGSTVLLICGTYVPVITAVKEILHLNLTFLPMIIIFALGILSGTLASVKTIQKSLIKHRPQTIMLIIGMLIGSLYAICMGPTTVSPSNEMLNIQNFNLIFFIVGILLIAGLELIKNRFEKSPVQSK